MPHTTLIFDLDDVLAQMRVPMSDVLSRLSGRPLHHRDWHTLCAKTLYGIDFCAETMVREGIIERCEPEPDAQQAMTALQRHGFRLAIATARGWHPEGISLTEAWLDRHKLPYDELHVVGYGETSSKAAVFDRIARHHRIFAFIDDQPRYLQQGVAHPSVERVVVQDRTWNRDVPLPRVYSLSEFARTLLTHDVK